VPDQVQPLDGVSLLLLIDGQMKERPRPIGFWALGFGQAWSDSRYKLVTRSSGNHELYDLTVDPSEKTDLAAKHPEIVNRMKAELENWKQSVQRSGRGEDYKGKPSTQT